MDDDKSTDFTYPRYLRPLHVPKNPAVWLFASDQNLKCTAWHGGPPPRILTNGHFVLFDGGRKKLPRVHQYFGIKAAQKHVRERRGGIIWHTQGSGIMPLAGLCRIDIQILCFGAV